MAVLRKVIGETVVFTGAGIGAKLLAGGTWRRSSSDEIILK
jgi:hypothetical protein